MYKNNKGFTLTEVIVSMVVLLILFIGVFSAFASLQRVNDIANKTQHENDLITSITEGMYDIEYDDINASIFTTKLIPPSIYSLDSYGTDNITYTQTEGHKNIHINNIHGPVSEYSVDMSITPIIDTKGFSDFTTTSRRDTTMLNVNVVGETGNSYDLMAINEYVTRNRSYIYSKYQEAVNEYNRIIELNEKMGADLTVPDEPILGEAPYNYQDITTIRNNVKENVNIAVKKIENTYYLTYDITYIIPDDLSLDWFGTTALGTYSVDIYSEYALTELSNLILLFPEAVGKSETITFTNGVSTIDNSEVELNLYLIYTPPIEEYVENTHHLYNLANKIEFNYKQVTGTPLITVYTNVEQIYTPTALPYALRWDNSIPYTTTTFPVQKHNQIFELEQLKNRIYTINIKVLEKTTNTFEQVEKTILVLKQ